MPLSTTKPVDLKSTAWCDYIRLHVSRLALTRTMILKLSYHCSLRNVTLKYNANRELVAKTWPGENHKVTHVQVLARKPVEGQFCKGLTETKWINVDFSVDSGVLAELIEKDVPLCHWRPDRFSRGQIEGQPEEEPWTLFGHSDVYAVRIFYD